MRRINLLRFFSRKLFIQKKRIYQFVKPYTNQKSILFIIGCQRSGTSIMLRILDKDLHTKIYKEFSKLSCGHRLKPLDLVKKEIQKDRAPLIIMKPLVETQNILQLLKYFGDSKALWMYRNYKDVALSNITKWRVRQGKEDLRPIVENKPENWRSEKVSENTRKIILRHFSEDMNPYDAAVLFWFARNSLFFELGMDKNPNILMCKYEDFTMFPVKVVSSLYRSLGQNYPGDKITAEINPKSIKKGKAVELSPEIEHLAKKLLYELDKAYQTK